MSYVAVEITVRKADSERFEALVSDYQSRLETNSCKFPWQRPGVTNQGAGVQLVTYGWEAVKFAVLGFEEELQNDLIPYSKTWSEEEGINQAEEHFRFDANHTPRLIQLTDEDRSISVQDLNEARLAGMLETVINERLEALDGLSWEQQEAVLMPLPPTKMFAEKRPGLVFNVPTWFEDPRFISWLNSRENPVMTWHTPGEEVGEYSDCVVFVDPSLDGDGSDQGAMPDVFWNAIVEMCKQHFSPDFSYSIAVQLTNLQED